MKDCFKDKVVLCTGAAQGIGLATAQEFVHISLLPSSKSKISCPLTKHNI